MYIQENSAEHNAPPDYSGHTYKVPERGEGTPPPPPFAQSEAIPAEQPPLTRVPGEETPENEKSAPVGAFSSGNHASPFPNTGKRGDFLGGGLGGLFSRIPLLSSLAPPPRRCEDAARKHSELWDLALLAVVALSLFNGKDDDVLPLLLLLLLWD